MADPDAGQPDRQPAARLAWHAARHDCERALRSRGHRQAAVAAGDEPTRNWRKRFPGRPNSTFRSTSPTSSSTTRCCATREDAKPAADGAKAGLDVLLVAARKDRIDDRAGVIAQTGRRPVVVDVEAFAIANAYQMNYPERTDPLSALIHVGRSMTVVCLLERGEPIFTRDISIGGQVHLNALLKEFGPIGVDELAAKRMLHGQYPADVSADQVAGVLREASAQLVLEVRKTVDFYRATSPIDRLSRVVLSGGAWQAVGLVDLLASEFGAPVDVFDPFRRVHAVGRAVGRRGGRARRTPSPSVSRCGRKATDDSRQSARRRARAPSQPRVLGARRTAARRSWASACCS